MFSSTKRKIFSSIVLILALLTPASAEIKPIPGIFSSEVPTLIQKRIEFWVQIYTKYTTSQGLIHDADHPEVIFEALNLEADQSDFSEPSKSSKKKREKRVNEAKEFYKKTLLSLHKKLGSKGEKKTELTAAEQRVFDLYKGVDEPDKFFRAAHNKRIRMQLGQRDRFQQGLYYSGRFLPVMEKIFSNAGIPPAITRLPFVESSFNLRARSKVGASGIWQFMRSTGKFFLRINDTIDERNDPIRATEAAAQLLKMNHDSLQEWPLAITAYNHGRIGMMRAVRKVASSSLVDVIKNYKSRTFGFASSNFFCEFAAAVEVERNAEKYFGKFEREDPIEFAEFTMQDYVSLQDLSTYSKIPLDTLYELNQALTDLVWRGTRLVPAGYILRVPKPYEKNFKDRYAQIPSHKKFASQQHAR